MITVDGKVYKLFPYEVLLPDTTPGCTGCAFRVQGCLNKETHGEDCRTGEMADWGIYKEVKDEPEHPSTPD